MRTNDPNSVSAPAGSAPTCCALAADDVEFKRCGAPALYRSPGGRPYCAEHAAQRLDLGAECYLIQKERPDPRGFRLILRVVRYDLSPSAVARLTRDRWRKFWDFAAEVAESAFKTVVGVLVLLAAVPWVLFAVPLKFIGSIFWAVTKPDEVRRACRIVDGLPPNPDSATCVAEGRP